jgi:hypothetical protein
MHSLLEELEDCTIQTGDGGEVRANTFMAVQSSAIFAQTFEDLLESEDDHQQQTATNTRVFLAPNVSQSTMQTLVDLWHKKRATSSLSDIQEIVDVLEAMRYLASDTKRSKIVSRLWSLVRASDDIQQLKTVAPLVLDHHHTEFLARCRQVAPRWTECRRVLDDVEIDLTRAAYITADLMSSYPCVVVVSYLLEKTCPDHRRDVMMTCLSVPRIGLYIHPDEYYVLLDMLLSTPAASHHPAGKTSSAPDSGWDTLARVCLQSCRDVNLPSCSTKVSGSVISFQTRSRISVFVHIKHRTSKIKINFSGVQISLEGAKVDVDADISKFDRNVHGGRVYLRLIPLYGFGVDDVEWGRVDDEMWLETLVDDDGKVVAGHGEVVSHPEMLRYLRADVYWGADPRL